MSLSVILRQVGGFLRFPSTNKTDPHDITEILLKVALHSTPYHNPNMRRTFINWYQFTWQFKVQCVLSSTKMRRRKVQGSAFRFIFKDQRKLLSASDTWQVNMPFLIRWTFLPPGSHICWSLSSRLVKP